MTDAELDLQIRECADRVNKLVEAVKDDPPTVDRAAALGALSSAGMILASLGADGFVLISFAESDA